jgi:phage protein D
MSGTDVQVGLAYRVKVNGQSADDRWLKQLVQVRVDQQVGLPDRTVLRFTDDEFALVDAGPFTLGAKLEVLTAVAAGRPLKRVFTGAVTGLEADMTEDGVYVEVTAVHDCAKLQHGTVAKGYVNVTPADAIRTAGSATGVRWGKINLPNVVYPLMHQAGETAWRFIERVCRAHGAELIVEDDKLSIREVDAAMSSGPELVLGTNLMSFRPRVSGQGQVKQVEVVTWDAAQKARTVATKPTKPPVGQHTRLHSQATTAAGAGKFSILDRPAASTRAAEAMATAAANHIGRSAFEAEAVCLGDPKLRPGVEVTLKKVGDRFGGTHQITGATHIVEGGLGYFTHLHIGSSAQRLAGARANGGRPRLATEGLMTALVSNVTDPNKQNRVKVKIPLFDDQYESDWCRVVRGSASKDRGIVAPLHVDDEVLIGFEHGDPERPYVLGALFNGRDLPGTGLTAPKDSLAVRVPKEIDVQTQQKATADAVTGMTVTSTNGPVEVKAAKDLTIKGGTGGPGKVTIEASGQLVAKGSQGLQLDGVTNVKITGVSIAVEATGALQLKGANVQIQGSAAVQVSAPAVMLG